MNNRNWPGCEGCALDTADHSIGSDTSCGYRINTMGARECWIPEGCLVIGDEIKHTSLLRRFMRLFT